MINKKNVLAVITARGGSKRLKDKNSKLLQGKALVSWTINAAMDSEYIDEVVLSTDSLEIARISEEEGLPVPFMRSASLATDEARSIDVVKDALLWYKEHKNRSFEYVVLLQPTSPFRKAQHIDEAFLELKKRQADAIISVCESEHNPLWSNILAPEKSLENFIQKENINLRSQDLENYYRLNGALYICDVKRLFEEDTFFIKSNIYAYEMRQIDSVDIDTKLDFLVAETILKEKENSSAE